jgi:hypothetical protein
MNLILVDAIMAVLFLLCASLCILIFFSELQWKSFASSMDKDLFFYTIE